MGWAGLGQAEVDAALKAYFKLATLGLACLKRGGLLVSASCSAHVQAEDFFDAVMQVETALAPSRGLERCGGELRRARVVCAQAVKRSGRSCEEVQRATQPHDHPAAIEEAKYLKCIYLRVR